MNTHVLPIDLVLAIRDILLTMPMKQVRQLVNTLEQATVEHNHATLADHVAPTVIECLRELPALIGESLALQTEDALANQDAIAAHVQGAEQAAADERARVAAEHDAAVKAEADAQAAALAAEAAAAAAVPAVATDAPAETGDVWPVTTPSATP